MNIITPEIYNDLTLLPEDLQGWNGNKPLFGELIKKYKPNHIIEVGSWKGQSAINMAKAIKEQKLNAKITCVDTWLGALEFIDKFAGSAERNLLMKHGYPQIYYQFLSNVVHNNVQDIILPIPNTSLIAARYFKAKGITAKMIYIDASHCFEDVIADCKAYFQLVESGGIMFGDDAGWATVIDAVAEFARNNNLTYTINDGFWIITKP